MTAGKLHDPYPPELGVGGYDTGDTGVRIKAIGLDFNTDQRRFGALIENYIGFYVNPPGSIFEKVDHYVIIGVSEVVKTLFMG